MVTARRTFTFEDVRPVLEGMVAKTSRLAVAHDFLRGLGDTAADKELIVREWSRLQLSQALLSLTTPDSEDVPIFISVIKEKGTCGCAECGMLNTFLKNTSAETTLGFLQAKRNHIEGYLRGASDVGMRLCV
ncbi:uncharacterized protein BT62DRAFT_934820 [Guyanagaster necrorhizus]|uniref:Uncharacterized protein n=1 Tax=Guyanagaster necrorhizus TaxID=856835 RepID=A0A9P7VPE9_9AGAR|nr:uncharacterized protein BT62DRAFT_934820 [Guyanagaster necrorhizus MCA 3950]KAG7443579.1 hypothetical protein BT62DRAFT_934820 [Guyanagaster necrorhizus MCA 3950]